MTDVVFSPQQGAILITATSGLTQVRSQYHGERREMLRILLNSTSVAEANIALDVLALTVSESTLIAACNLREVIKELPASPFAMNVDEASLSRTANMERHMASMGKILPDGIELIVTTAGNLVLDIIIKDRGSKFFWNPMPVTDDYVNGSVLDLLITSDHLLDEVIALATAMGMVFNPSFYLSLEDWHLEYASDVFAGMRDLF
jgi:hypothetical protein